MENGTRMDIRQFIEWGKHYWFQCPKFSIFIKGHIIPVTGHWVDAYFETVRLDKLPSDQVVMIKQLEEVYGRDIMFQSDEPDCPWPILRGEKV